MGPPLRSTLLNEVRRSRPCDYCEGCLRLTDGFLLLFDHRHPIIAVANQVVLIPQKN